MIETPTLKTTMQIMLEIAKIADNIRAAVQRGELTAAEAAKLLNDFLKG